MLSPLAQRNIGLKYLEGLLYNHGYKIARSAQIGALFIDQGITYKLEILKNAPGRPAFSLDDMTILRELYMRYSHHLKTHYPPWIVKRVHWDSTRKQSESKICICNRLNILLWRPSH